MLTRDQTMDGFRLRAELAVDLVRWGPGSSRLSGRWRSGGRCTSSRSSSLRGRGGRVLRGAAWSAAEALEIEYRFPDRVPLRLLADTLKTAVASTSLARLSQALTSRWLPETFEPGDQDVRYLAALRLEEHGPWYDAIGASFDRALRNVVLGGASGIALTSVPNPPSTVSQLRVAAVIASVMGLHLIELSTVRTMLGSGLTLTSDEARMIESGLGGNVRIEQVAYTAMMASPKFPPRELLGPDARFDWLEGCVIAEGGESTPVLVHYLRRQFEQFAMYAETLKGDVRAYAATLLGHRLDHPERVLRATEKFAQDWVKDVQSVESRFGRRKARF